MITILEYIPQPRRDKSVTDWRQDLIVIAVRREIRNCGYRALRQVDCHIQGGTLFLTGRLPNYYLKQVAQETVRRVTLDLSIRNDIKVTVGDGRSQEETTR